ncbi:glycoside hydrolase family 1 protein, partial [Xanthomonas oryzae]|uniref:glycoside hydrolase family 1 protein n=1 Tax=Xanthomonas oryzae TaxID=347 RepID=UPI00095AD4B5
DVLLAADIGPSLTLYHWDMPQALQEIGGWPKRDSVNRFLEYAGTMHDALGDRVNVWTTLNEPWCSSFLSYTGGEHAPGHTSVAEGLLASHHLLLAHGATVRELRGRDASLNLGITLNHTVADPADPQNPADVDAARRLDGQFNRWFLDPIYRGAYPADTVEDIRAVDPEGVARFEAAVHEGDLDTIAQPIDTQGVNYYHGDLVSGTGPDDAAVSSGPETAHVTRSPYPSHEGIHAVERGLPRTAQGWEVQPEGLTRLLQRLWTEY